MRRLPVYLLIDTSGSMTGEPIEAVKVGLQTMVSALRAGWLGGLLRAVKLNQSLSISGPSDVSGWNFMRG